MFLGNNGTHSEKCAASTVSCISYDIYHIYDIYHMYEIYHIYDIYHIVRIGRVNRTYIYGMVLYVAVYTYIHVMVYVGLYTRVDVYGICTRALTQNFFVAQASRPFALSGSGALLRLAVLLSSFRPWSGTSRCDFFYFPLFSSFSETFLFYCRHSAHGVVIFFIFIF
jgi:hypothetical protein